MFWLENFPHEEDDNNDVHQQASAAGVTEYAQYIHKLVRVYCSWFCDLSEMKHGPETLVQTILVLLTTCNMFPLVTLLPTSRSYRLNLSFCYDLFTWMKSL